MIGYVTLGTNDLERAAKFYDGLLSALGARRVQVRQRSIAWGAKMKGHQGTGAMMKASMLDTSVISTATN